MGFEGELRSATTSTLNSGSWIPCILVVGFETSVNDSGGKGNASWSDKCTVRGGEWFFLVLVDLSLLLFRILSSSCSDKCTVRGVEWFFVVMDLSLWSSWLSLFIFQIQSSATASKRAWMASSSVLVSVFCTTDDWEPKQHIMTVEGGIGVLLASFSITKSSFLLSQNVLKWKQSFVSW